MARPLKEHLEYFPLDCNMDSNFRILEARHGIIGFGIMIKIYQQIYGDNGYYMMWDKNNILLFAKEIEIDGVDITGRINLVKDVVNTAFEQGILSKSMYERYEILTSRGIQKRYVEAMKRHKKILMIEEYLLLKSPEKTVNVAEIEDNVTETGVNADDNATNKIKENKIKKNKKSKNTFNDFEQHEYSLEEMREIERKLASKSAI